MNLPAGWKFAVETFPADWRFPSGSSWIAGWIRLPPGDTVTDVRAKIGPKRFLGLHGVPHPSDDKKSVVSPGPFFSGFSFLVTPPARAGQLMLEARDLAGRWTEFYRTRIEVPSDAPPQAPAGNLADRLPALVPVILRQARRQPELSWTELAHQSLSAVLAEPLNTLPNPPLVGALEEPTATGRVPQGRLSVTGWLTHRSIPVKRLIAVVDPLRSSELVHGLVRQDIARVHTGLEHQVNCGFSGQVDLPAGMAAPVLLKIFADLGNGETHLAFAQRFTPGSSSRAPTPAVSGWHFARAVWALRRAARLQELPTAGVFSAARAVWSGFPARPPAVPAIPPLPPARKHPLRILVFTHNLNFEGAPRLILELAAFFHRQPGHSVRVVSSADGPLRRMFETAGMNVTVLDPSPALGAGTPDEFQVRLRELGAKIDWTAIDLVVANTLASFWGVHLAHQAGRPAVFYVHESAPVDRFFGPRLAETLQPVAQQAFGLARHVVFTADASRQVFASLEHHRNFRVLPSWLDVAGITEFMARHDRAALRTKHGFAPDSIVLLNLGTVCERKGQHVFVQAAELLEPELRARFPDRRFEFVLVGAREDPFLQGLQAEVARAQLPHVRFVPETRENYDFHRIADLLVCTSFEESSPRVLLEAASFGTPIVSTDVNGIPEMLTGREAWLVEPGDPYLLADALRRALAALLASDTDRPDRARAAVAQRFDERLSLPHHLALAHEAAAQQPA